MSKQKRWFELFTEAGKHTNSPAATMSVVQELYWLEYPEDRPVEKCYECGRSCSCQSS